jgi:hypothetical protein
MTSIMLKQMMVDLISAQTAKEEAKNIWRLSPFRDLVKLQSNNAGNVGEGFLQGLCDKVGISANIDGAKTKKVGGGSGDGTIKEKTVEIKTAHQGSGSPSFQHELGEKPWNAEYMVFIDISPECIYLTIFKNFTEVFYKSHEKCEPYFPTKRVTWRKEKGAFKLDTSVQINESNIANGYTFKISGVDEEADPVALAAFIDSRIE